MSAAAEAGLLEQLIEPRTTAYLSQHTGVPAELVERILDVLIALGLVSRQGDDFSSSHGLLPLLRSPEKEDLLADLRATYLQSRQLVDGAKHRNITPGWHHDDPEILQSQGAGGRALTEMLARQIIPAMDGLEDRFHSPTASFLDIGTGVGVIAIELCRHFPNLHVVGLEPQDAPLAEARHNVAAVGFGDRIELRHQGLEDLRDREAFDLAYLPQVFMPVDVVERGLPAIRNALRPGGWVLLVAISAPGADLGSALSRLRNVLWGGEALYPEQVAEMVRAAGFDSVRVVGPPDSTTKGIVGRRVG